MQIDETRGLEFTKLTDWLDTARSRDGVSIIGISGYGGIGKSYLLNEVLRQNPAKNFGFCDIRVDGSDRSIVGHFMKLLNSGFAPQKLPGGALKNDYFPQVRKLYKAHTELLQSVGKEVDDKKLSEQLKTAVDYLLRVGAILNRTIPPSAKFVDAEAVRALGIENFIDEAFELIPDLNAMDVDTWIPDPIGDLFGLNFRKRLRTDFFELAADCYFGDLSAAIAGYRTEDRLKITHKHVEGLKGLLLIIDDFEIVGKSTSEFLVANLIPLLENAAFPSTVIIVGRDDIKDAHIGFQHHHANKIVGCLRLETLCFDIAKKLLTDAGYSDAEAGDLAKNSEGYPFLISILCEAKDRSVSFYQRFYDRTTRWMTAMEKEWVIPLSYLDRIDEGSIGKMLPEEDAHLIMNWFKREASIRDPDASFYAISPLIRNMILEHNLRVVGPEKHHLMNERARAAVNI